MFSGCPGFDCQFLVRQYMIEHASILVAELLMIACLLKKPVIL